MLYKRRIIGFGSRGFESSRMDKKRETTCKLVATSKMERLKINTSYSLDIRILCKFLGMLHDKKVSDHTPVKSN